MAKALRSDALLQSIKLSSLDTKWPLVQRDDIIEFFNEEILTKGPLHGEYKCYLLRGNGGMGKSFYCEKYLESCLEDFEQCIYYDFDMHKEDATTGDIFLSWVNLIKEKNPKYNFYMLEFTYNQYQKVLGKTEKTLERELIQDKNIINGLLELVSMASGVIASTIRVAEIGLRAVKELFEEEKTFFMMVNECTDINTLEQLMVVAFCKDMETNFEIAEYYPFVFFIDTYEVYASNKRAYCRKDKWLENLILTLPNAMWIIAGREKPVWDKVTFDKEFDMEPITADDAFEEIFECVHIYDSKVKSDIRAKSAGNPFHLKMLVNDFLRGTNVAQLERLDTTKLVAERLLRYLDNEASNLAYGLSILESWNGEVLSDYTKELGLQIADISVLRDSGLIKEGRMERYVYSALQTSVDEALVRKAYLFFEKRLKDNDSDAYARLRYIKCLTLLYEKNRDDCTAEYEKCIRDNIYRWINMALSHIYFSFENEFLPIWEKIEKTDSIYLDCLLVYRIYLESCENKVLALETIDADVETSLIEKSVGDELLAFSLLQNYIFLDCFEWADLLINSLEQVRPMDTLGEEDFLGRLGALIQFCCKQGRYNESYELYDRITKVSISEENAYMYIKTIYDFLDVVMRANDFERHKKLVDEGIALCDIYLNKDSELRHLFMNEYLMQNNKLANDVDTSELARTEYEYKMSHYLPNMVEGISEAKANLAVRLYDNEYYDEAIELFGELLGLYQKYPDKCMETYYVARRFLPQIYLRKNELDIALNMAEENISLAQELQDCETKEKLYLLSGYIFFNVAEIRGYDKGLLQRANKQYIQAIKVCKKLWGENAIQLVKAYTQLAQVKFFMLDNKESAINILSKAINISDEFYGEEYVEREDMLELLRTYEEYV